MANNIKFYNSSVSRYYFGEYAVDQIFFGTNHVYQRMKAPTFYNLAAIDDNTIAINLSNPNNVPVTIYYGFNQNVDKGGVVADANDNTGTIYIGNLSPGTTYNLYAQAYYNPLGVYSSISGPSAGITTTITTATPNITNYGVRLKTFNEFYWKVLNLDASTVTIYTEANNSTPDYSIADVASNTATSEIIHNMPTGTTNITVYAKAKASNKNLSAYDSQVVSTQIE